MLAEILKSVDSSLSIIGLILSITPNCFALLITPSVPVNFKFNFFANFKHWLYLILGQTMKC